MSGATPADRPGLFARLFAPRPLRWSLVELCRRTTHEGWEHLQAAEAAGRGVALVTPSGTPWVVAARALAVWAGPLHLALPESAADRKLARLVCASEDGPDLVADREAAARALGGGEKILFVVENEGLSNPGRAPIPTPARVIPLRVGRIDRGRYRLVLG